MAAATSRDPTGFREIPLARTADGNGQELVTEPAGLAGLYSQHGRACFALALAVTGDRARAEDIVTCAFLTFWQNRDPTDCHRLSIRARLLAVTHHRAVQMQRRDKPRHRSITGWQQLLAGAPGASQPHSENGALPIEAALALLTGHERQALALAYFGGYTQDEIAELTGVPLAITRAHTLTAMRSLRR